ncbi:GroES-like protein [Athelia psychrophila]|uniref:GroES-like protein n=1 Tax=Athelia psychrophila TaxID=1759441 RepID=A0A165XSJ8_9AGAM|nr:GroES-like protein [Fibularhizoctonia sp. CBS 109695]
MSIPTKIKAVKSQPGEGLAIEEVSLSTSLAPYEVLLKNRAVGLNPTDWKHSIGMWGDAGFVVGCDGAGDVVAVGSEVKHVQVGDRVGAFLYGTQDESNGAFAEYARYNCSSVWKLPEGMSFAEAASFPVPFLTAVQKFVFPARPPLSVHCEIWHTPHGELQILIWGGSTAVGLHAIQLAHLSGQRVIAIASARNHEFLKSIGADVAIDYEAEDVVKQIRDSLDGLPLKRAIDTVCEKGSTHHVIDAIDPEGGYVTTTLPVDDETSSRRAQVKVEFVLDTPIKFAKVLPMPFIPEDNERAQAWNTHEQSTIGDGLVEGKGNKCGSTTQKLRVREGLEDVMEGVKIMKRGAYGEDKLFLF